MPYGIEALNVYAGLACISVPAMFAGRGLDQDRIPNIAMSQRSVGLPFEDPVTNAVNAARPLLDRLDEQARGAVEVLITSTESGLDLSKSVASYVHEYLGLSRNCRLLEVKQACYGATCALQLAAGFLAQSATPGAKALVIATDVALVDERAGYAESATGHGAVALLIGDEPTVLALDGGAYGCYSYDVLDSARPTPEFDIADGDRSLFAYLDCLAGSLADYQDRVDDVDIRSSFQHLALHTPFGGLVRAAHRMLLRPFGLSAPQVDSDFARRVAPSLVYPALTGNLCSGSLYLALASVLENSADLAGSAAQRIGLFSYGSGCSSEFFSGLIDSRSVAAVRSMGIGTQLASRRELDFAHYLEVLPHSLKALVPRQHAEVELGRWAEYLDTDRTLLVHTRTKDYHRAYEWHGPLGPA
jgi:polyketide biosynthesis 3-hydroxy-3-methylglutaryl-CoA synthase-like enzyme PksG